MADERAVSLMLGARGVPLLRKLNKHIKKDPDYLNSHRSSVRQEVERILNSGGIHWHQEIFDREWMETVSEALTRLQRR